MIPDDSFIVNETHSFSPDIVFLISVRSGELTGARIGGQIVVGSLGPKSANPASYASADLLSRVLATSRDAAELRKLHKKNFAYSSGELLEARVSTRRALWTGPVPNSGSITLIPRSGRRRRLILLGNQDIRSVRALIQSAGIPVEPLAV
ncbi:MAG: hypothetical protein JRG80_18555 [Deltaproteobacteria bacterium]|nr:hypothetical protein [Deltaproteobacteria bacterium]